MAKKEISIVLRAKNELQVGLAKAGASLKKFGQSVGNIAKTMAKAFVAVGAALAGMAVKSLSAYSVQQKAVTSLQAAFRAYGEEVEVNTERIRQLASAIQDETGVSDDDMVARAARLKMLGVETEQLGDAMRATVALKSANMDGEQAVRAVALAMSGNYSALQRYIPELRNATTEAEKAKIVNDFLNRAYNQQKDQLKTLSGQWGLLKERTADAWEEVGKILNNSAAVQSSLAGISEKVKSVAIEIEKWGETNGPERLKLMVKVALEEIRHSVEDALLVVMALWGQMGDPKPVRWSLGVIGESFKMLAANALYAAEAAKNLWEFLKRPASGFKIPNESGLLEQGKRLEDALSGKNISERDHYGEMMKMREVAAREHAARVAEIQKQSADEMEAQNEKLFAKEKVRRDAALANERDAAGRLIDAKTGESGQLIRLQANVSDATAEQIRARLAEEEGAADQTATIGEETTGILGGQSTRRLGTETANRAASVASEQSSGDMIRGITKAVTDQINAQTDARLVKEVEMTNAAVVAHQSAAQSIMALWEQAFAAISAGIDALIGKLTELSNSINNTATAAQNAQRTSGSSSSGATRTEVYSTPYTQAQMSANPGKYTQIDGKWYRHKGSKMGNVVSGPSSGYAHTLHGTEAVLPLRRGANGVLGVSTGGGGRYDKLVYRELQKIRQTNEQLLRWN